MVRSLAQEVYNGGVYPMNFNHYYTCECGFEKSFNEGVHFVVIQCKGCYDMKWVEGIKSYLLGCRACGHQKKIGSALTLDGDVVCAGCGVAGAIDALSLGTGLFDLLNDPATFEDCGRCGRNDWTDWTEQKEGFKCPRCRKELEQALSNFWE